jgi:hypothetical protein
VAPSALLRDIRFGSGLRGELERRSNSEDASPVPTPGEDEQPVSPELVLVCPELRAAELSRLS